MVILKFIYTCYAWLTWSIIAIPTFLWAILISVIRGKKGHANIIFSYKSFAYLWFFLIGIRMKLFGKENRDNSEPCFIVSNHISNIDMMTAPYVLPTKLSPLAKEELKKIPVLGLMFKVVSVMVNRKDIESRKRSMKEMAKRINEGIYIYMFPEGTRNRTKEPLKDFYDGAFKMAIELQKPILPLVMCGLRKVAPMKPALLWPGKITATYFPSISTVGMTEADLPALKQKVYDIMYQHILTNDSYYSKK